jgi:hypothetical protein
MASPTSTRCLSAAECRPLISDAELVALAIEQAAIGISSDHQTDAARTPPGSPSESPNGSR